MAITCIVSSDAVTSTRCCFREASRKLTWRLAPLNCSASLSRDAATCSYIYSQRTLFYIQG